MADYKENVNIWKENVKDTILKAELAALTDETELKDRFYKDLEFGTGGLRGILGVGTNCLNVYTVARASEGIAAYMKAHGMKKIAVSYDSRINSELFAKTAARAFAANGLKTVIVKELMPTPFLSFLTREEKCDMGAMITASHNPAKYNGYKVYNSDGCQIVDAAAKEISSFIDQTPYFGKEPKAFEEYLSSGEIVYASDAVEEKYLGGVKNIVKASPSALKVTYTALNGTGYRIIPKLLKTAVSEVKLVKEQCVPDGNFPTCPYPNPEKSEALALGLKEAEKNGSDILLATDPDADRVGVAVKTENGYELLTGNEVGVLLTDYLLSDMKRKNLPTDRAVIVKTIVTTKLAELIAEKYDASVINVLTGFKYIGEQIGLLEQRGEADRFLLGFEESYGYLLGTEVRDKDAVVAVLAVCNAAAHYLSEGKTLLGRLQEIYAEYGKFYHKLLTFEFAGAAGKEHIEKTMKNLRGDCATFLGRKVIKATDYLQSEKTGLPRSNVLALEFEGNAGVVVRPSGTEPLLKVYVTSCGKEDAALYADLSAFFKA
ncbi:MAG: phosphoglucomutase [Bacillota bacterium]|nr:MAG: phosphoglucomutase [Bacillota bacterium]